jgi:hypothetical protein
MDYQKCNEAPQSRRLPSSVRRFCLLLFLAGCLLAPIGSDGAAQKKAPSKQSSANERPKKGFGGKYQDFSPWQLVCSKNGIPQRQAIEAMGDNRAFGNYYASTFQLNLQGDPAYLWKLWAMERGQWMIIYWKVIAS